MGNVVGIVIEINYFHMNMNGVVFHADSTQQKESTNSLKYNEKKINFINRLKYAEVKIFSMFVDVYKIYEGNDFDKIYEVLSTLKNKKLEINIILIEKYRVLLENPNFEQNKYSLTSTGIYKIAHDSIKLMKWICYYDRSYYGSNISYDLMESICEFLNEISKR